MGRGGAGGVSPRAGHLPAVAWLFPWRGGAAACALARASRRISHAAAPGATPKPQRARGAAVLYRPVPGGSRVLAGTEITMQRAEAARRNRGGDRGATPHLTAASAARH